MAGGFESVGKGLGVGLAFFLLLYFITKDEEHRAYEKALIERDPVEVADITFEKGERYFYELKELDVQAINDGEKEPYFVCGYRKIDPAILEAFPERVKFQSWTSPFMGPDVYADYRRAHRFASQFNIRMAARIESESSK